jgi:hypothetical protein
MNDDQNLVSPIEYHHLTGKTYRGCQCVHKYVAGFEIRMSPGFESDEYNNFDLTGGKPWERAADMAIADAPAPIDYIDIDPFRLVVVYRTKANVPCEVIVWKDTTSATVEQTAEAMRKGCKSLIGDAEVIPE